MAAATQGNAGKKKEVYCLCRRSDDTGFMIACDVCDEWYHGACVGLTAAVGKRIEKYTCPLCDDALHSQIVMKAESVASSTGKKRARDEAKEKEEKEAEESAAAQANALRALVRNTLAEALFQSYRVDEEHTHPDEVARLIEAELVKIYGLASKEYKARYRSLLSNMKDTRNSDLRLRTLSGQLKPDELCRMRSEDLAPKELAALRKQREEAYLKEVIIKSGDAAPEALPVLKFTAPLQKDDSITSFIQRTRKLEAAESAAPISTSADGVSSSNADAKPAESLKVSNEGVQEKGAQAEEVGAVTTPPPAVEDEQPAIAEETPLSKRRREELEEEKERERELERQRERERRKEERLREMEAPLKAKERSAVVDAILSDFDVSRLASSASSEPLIPLAPSDIVPPSSAPLASSTINPPTAPQPPVAAPAPSAPVVVPTTPKRAEEAVLWRGSITNIGTPNFAALALALPVAVSDAMLLPSSLTIVGRMDLRALLKYLNELDRSSTRRRSAFLLEPASDVDASSYAALYEFLKSRGRGGVVQVSADKGALKELFILPVALSSSLPHFLSLAKPRRSDTLWAVQVLALNAAPTSPPGPLSRAPSAPSPAPLALSSSSSGPLPPVAGAPVGVSAVDAFLSKFSGATAAPTAPPTAVSTAAPSAAALAALPPGFQAFLNSAAPVAFPAVPLGPTAHTQLPPPSHFPPSAPIHHSSHPNTRFSPPSGFTLAPSSSFSPAPHTGFSPPPSGFSPPVGPSSAYGPPHGGPTPGFSPPPPTGFSNAPPPPRGNWSSGPPPDNRRGPPPGHGKPRSGWDRR